MSEPLLTARQVGDQLGVTAETILRWTRAGELPAIRLPGTSRGRLRYRPDDIDAWLEQHMATPGREAPATLSGAANGRLTSSVPAIPPHTLAASTEED